MTKLVLAALLACSLNALAQPATPRTRAPISAETASALVSDASSARRLSAEGQLIYENSRRQLTWGQYCAGAMTLNDQGMLRNAIRSASQALFLGEKTNDSTATAFAKRDLAVSYLYSGDLETADRFARESLLIPMMNMNNVWNVRSVSHKTVGDVHARRGQWDQAIHQYEEAAGNSSGAWKRLVRVSLANAYLGAGNYARANEIVDDLGGSLESPVKEVLLRTRGNLLLKAGKPDEALKVFRQIAAASDEKDGAYHRVWALEGEARALRALGDNPGAAKALLSAIDSAEQVRARFRSEEFKTGTFGDLQDIFSAAISVLVDNGEPGRALEVSEAGRSRALLDLMRKRVKMTDGKTILNDRFARPIKPDAVQALLGPQDVVVAYHVAADKTFAWLIRKDAIRAVTLPVRPEALRAIVHDVRKQIVLQDPQVKQTAQRAYDALVKPLGLGAADNLVIVPHDALHLLPFQALHDGTRFLIEAAPISYAPSLSSLAQVMDRRASVAQKMVAFGNPDLGNAALALPGAEKEVANLRLLFADTSVFLKENATKAHFLAEAPRHSIVHVAAHAEFDSVDPLYSRVRLSPTSENSGVLEAHEIYRINLKDTALMTLSACESGVVRVTRGDEVWGFSRAFLSAGASALLLSLWPVADESTDLLMSSFYRGMKSNGTRESLRAAQLELVANPNLSHPYYWSAFNLTGDWR